MARRSLSWRPAPRPPPSRLRHHPRLRYLSSYCCWRRRPLTCRLAWSCLFSFACRLRLLVECWRSHRSYCRRRCPRQTSRKICREIFEKTSRLISLTCFGRRSCRRRHRHHLHYWGWIMAYFWLCLFRCVFRWLACLFASGHPPRLCLMSLSCHHHPFDFGSAATFSCSKIDWFTDLPYR